MTNLNDLMGATSAPISLQEVIGTQLPSVQPPDSAIRNRAATLALATEPDKVMENYQVMVAEGAEGKDDYAKYQHSKVVASMRTQDEKAALEILSSPTATFEQKQAAIQAIKIKPELKDSTHSLFTNLASKGSYGETRSTEDARVNATVNAINEIHQQRQERQQLVNAFAAGLRGGDAQTVGEAAAYWVLPFGTNIAQAKEIAGSGAGAYEVLKGFFAPGSSIMDQRKKLEQLPVSERNAAIKNILENLKNKSGVIFSDNDFQEFAKVQAVLEEDGYTDVDKWIDNVSSLLDIVGVGSGIRSLVKGAKGLKKASEAERIAFKEKLATKPSTPAIEAPQTTAVAPVATPPIESPKTTYSWSIGNRSFQDTQNQVGAFQDKLIKDLEDEKASLLGTAGEIADKGAIAKVEQELKVIRSEQEVEVKTLAKEIQKKEKVSYKEALKLAEKEAASSNSALQNRIARLEGFIENNRSAAKATQRIVEIDKELEQLKQARVGMPSQKTAIADLVSRIQINATVHPSNPMSPHGVAKQANPEAAANSFEAIYKSEGDAVAEAMAGVSKNDAIADDILPQATTASGRVTAQPVNIQRKLYDMLPDVVKNFMRSVVRSDFTDIEKAAIVRNINSEFRAASEMHLHETMGGFQTKFTSTGERVEISALYGKADGAWDNAQDAVDQAKLSLRKYGVKDEDIQILKHDGLDYVPTTLDEVKDKPGSYYIRISMDHALDPTDVVKFEGVSTRLNWADSLPSFQGGNSAYLFDAASRLDPKIYGPAATATDHTAKFDKLMLDFASEFSNRWKKLDDVGRMKVDEYIIDANLNGVKFDPVDMRLRLGMSDDQIEAVRKWREYWDGQYYLENADLVRTFNEQGIQLYDDGVDRFFAKPVGKNQNIRYVYNPGTRTVISLTKDEMDALYTAGGNYARFRRPVDFNGMIVDHMIVYNNGSSYTRRLRDSDSVLNYREGYFTIHYDNPRFVDKLVTDANGNKVRTTIAVAKDTPEAEAFVRRMQANAAPDEKFIHRMDERALRRSSDEWFDIEGARGRIAQRHRGQNLQDASGVSHLGGMEYVENPVMSAIKSAKSVAGRTMMRPVIETAKARLTEQFGHLFRTDAYGQPKWPSSISEIGDKGQEFSKEVRDARTNWNYINYLENGYINGMDTFLKHAFVWMSEIAGEKGLGKTQRALLKAGQTSPTHMGKGAVFTAFIATNPLRQYLIQSHQAIRLFGYNPKWIGSDEIVKGLPALFMYKLNGTKPLGMESFIDFVEGTGILSSIDKQNLVRGTLKDAAERTSFASKAVGKPLEYARLVGFDAGESTNMLATMAAVFNRYKSAGKNVDDPAIREAMHRETRAISYEMNFAGDMPYNQNSAAIFLQFMQVPHKAMLQFTNRNLDGWTKVRLGLTDLMVFGPPIIAINSIYQNLFGEDLIPENKTAREVLVYGLEAAAFNSVLREYAKDASVGIDFSSLSPYGFDGFAAGIYASLTGGVNDAFMNSPAGTLFFKDGGKVRNALQSAMRFMRISEPVGMEPDTFMHVMREAARISSGFSNAEKAAMMLEANKRMDAYGRSPEMVAQVEALAQAFGFGSLSQKQLFEFTKARKDVEKEFEKEVISSYKKTLRYAQDQMGSGITDLDQLNYVTNFFLAKYRNNPEALKIINKQFSMDLQDPTARILANIIRTANIPGMEKTVDEIKNLPGVSDADKQKAIDISQQFRKAE